MGTNSTPKPAATCGVPSPTPVDDGDVVAGDPPVPITVWRTTRTDADGPGVVGRRLAARIVSAYSRPGEPVVDLTDGDTVAAACRAGGRRHHRAWFTDASALIVGAATPAPPSGTDPQPDEDAGQPVDVHVWFGDDLTDPNLPPPAADPPAADDERGGLAGRTGLVVAVWPLDPTDVAASQSRLRFLLLACRRLLRRPGGCLVLVVTSGDHPTPEDFTPLGTAANEVGLAYLQHIVAIDADADTDGDRFTYYATDADLTHLTRPHKSEGGGTGGHWYLHMRVHQDLLVFLAVDGGARC
jgi:hypothetical protein